MSNQDKLVAAANAFREADLVHHQSERELAEAEAQLVRAEKNHRETRIALNRAHNALSEVATLEDSERVTGY